MKVVLCAVIACLLSSCIILPYDHGWGHDHDRGWGHEHWGGWHGEGRGR